MMHSDGKKWIKKEYLRLPVTAPSMSVPLCLVKFDLILPHLILANGARVLERVKKLCECCFVSMLCVMSKKDGGSLSIYAWN